MAANEPRAHLIKGTSLMQDRGEVGRATKKKIEHMLDHNQNNQNK